MKIDFTQYKKLIKTTKVAMVFKRKLQLNSEIITQEERPTIQG